MSYDDYDYENDWDYKQEEYEAELVQKGLKDQRDEQIREYLGVYGDAVQERIDSCIAEARSLLEQGFPSASLVRAVTGTELANRYFVLRPVIGIAFLSEEWQRSRFSGIQTGSPHPIATCSPPCSRHGRSIWNRSSWRRLPTLENVRRYPCRQAKQGCSTTKETLPATSRLRLPSRCWKAFLSPSLARSQTHLDSAGRRLESGRSDSKESARKPQGTVEPASPFTGR